MSAEKYNGWTNYATWRVNLEILGDIQWASDETITVDYLKEIVENVVFDNCGCNGSLVADYARSFLSDVNYYEIAESIREELYER
jgi:hypothetical protein